MTLDSGQAYILKIYDTDSGDLESHLHSTIYPGTDVFLICFDTSTSLSYLTIERYQLREIKQIAPKARFVLVGLQTDQRDIRMNSRRWRPVTPSGPFFSRPVPSEQAKLLAWRYGGTYIEGSVRNARSGLDNLAVGVCSLEFKPLKLR